MKSCYLLGSLVLAGCATATQKWQKRPCSEAEVALAAGIHLNINGQWAEYNNTVLVEQAEEAHPSGPNPSIYNAIGKLQSVIQSGQNIRLFNQQVAPPGNPAIPGIQTYDMAEETEKALAANLTGTLANDQSALNSLKSDIMTGIKLNHHNLELAVSECNFQLHFPPADEQGS